MPLTSLVIDDGGTLRPASCARLSVPRNRESVISTLRGATSKLRKQRGDPSQHGDVVLDGDRLEARLEREGALRVRAAG